MKIIILNTDYPDFLKSLYTHRPGLSTESYVEQLKVRMDSFFGVADYYSSNLRKLGHEAFDIHANNEIMQKAWALEHGLKIHSDFKWTLGRRKTIIPWVSRRTTSRWIYQVLTAQIKHYKPDVLLNQAMDGIPSSFFMEMKPHIRLLVGQHAAPMPRDLDYSCYDIFISSLPNFVDHFRSLGIRSELSRLAFEPRILQRLGERCPTIPISFVGSLSPNHASRISLLETLCNRSSIRIWGNVADTLPENLHINRRLEKPVWGLEMYKILQRSQVTLNHHIEIAESYANNMRLYEATGVGALLITDWKQNLHEIFEVGKEVVAYCSPEECFELTQYYLSHPDEAEKIARTGQQRTLRDHTYAKRIEELVEIVKKIL
jgi:spore maturation protein CgeB